MTTTRHQRRKAAKLRSNTKLEALAVAERARRISAIVRDNKSKPMERNFYKHAVSTVYSGEYASRAVLSGWYRGSPKKKDLTCDLNGPIKGQ